MEIASLPQGNLAQDVRLGPLTPPHVSEGVRVRGAVSLAPCQRFSGVFPIRVTLPFLLNIYYEKKAKERGRQDASLFVAWDGAWSSFLGAQACSAVRDLVRSSPRQARQAPYPLVRFGARRASEGGEHKAKGPCFRPVCNRFLLACWLSNPYLFECKGERVSNKGMRGREYPRRAYRAFCLIKRGPRRGVPLPTHVSSGTTP